MRQFEESLLHEPPTDFKTWSRNVKKKLLDGVYDTIKEDSRVTEELLDHIMGVISEQSLALLTIDVQDRENQWRAHVTSLMRKQDVQRAKYNERLAQARHEEDVQRAKYNDMLAKAQYEEDLLVKEKADLRTRLDTVTREKNVMLGELDEEWRTKYNKQLAKARRQEDSFVEEKAKLRTKLDAVTSELEVLHSHHGALKQAYNNLQKQTTKHKTNNLFTDTQSNLYL